MRWQRALSGARAEPESNLCMDSCNVQVRNTIGAPCLQYQWSRSTPDHRRVCVSLPLRRRCYLGVLAMRARIGKRRARSGWRAFNVVARPCPPCRHGPSGTECVTLRASMKVVLNCAIVDPMLSDHVQRHGIDVERRVSSTLVRQVNGVPLAGAAPSGNHPTLPSPLLAAKIPSAWREYQHTHTHTEKHTTICPCEMGGPPPRMQTEVESAFPYKSQWSSICSRRNGGTKLPQPNL